MFIHQFLFNCFNVPFFYIYKLKLFIWIIFQVYEWKIGKDRVKSKLEIDPATQMDAGVYECTADNMYSLDRRSFKTDFSIAFD